MNEQLRISIGIPAYNEARNIRELLMALLEQKQGCFSLEEIIVVCDGCDDGTAALARSFAHPLIKVIENKERLGQQTRQNDIARSYRGEILILLEADTLPAKSDTLEKLVAPFLSPDMSAPVSMVVGSSRSIEPISFFERVLYCGSRLKQGIFAEWKSGLNIYVCHGHSGRALARAFTEQVYWPTDVPEDAYLYMRLRQRGLALERVPEASFYSRNAATFSDRKKQVEKYLSGKKALEKYFDRRTLVLEYTLPKLLITKHILLAFLRTSLWTGAYLIELFLNRILSVRRHHFDILPVPAYSTKQLKVSSKH